MVDSALRRVGLSLSPAHLPRHEGRQGRAGDAVAVEVVALVSEVSAIAGSSDSVSGPPEEDGGLGYVERQSPVLEHLWNTNAVDGWGSLVILRLLRRYAA